MSLRVLHIHGSPGPAGGTGGISMQRLHRRLLEQGFDSKILALDADPNRPDVSRLPAIDRFSCEGWLRSLTGRLGLNDVHRLGSYLLDRHTFFQNADIVHFHSTHSGAFSYLAMPRVARCKPCVFTLHDMWALTGHCAYGFECERWRSGCGDCPYPGEDPPVRRDATRLEWHLKQRAFDRARPHLVTKSGWSSRMVSVSALRHLPLTEIPYGVDTEVFRPRGRSESREVLGLPLEDSVLLISANRPPGRRKGADLLARALQELPVDLAARVRLLTMGEHGADLARNTGLPARNLGYVADDHLRAHAYSAADLFLLPTRVDVFGLASIESQACGTPVVSFRTGGVPDHVRPGRTGFLAEPEDALGFRDGVALLLESPDALRRLAGTCREVAVAEYDLTIETRRHVELYDAAIREAGRVGTAPPVTVPPPAESEARVTTCARDARVRSPVAHRDGGE